MQQNYTQVMTWQPSGHYVKIQINILSVALVN